MCLAQREADVSSPSVWRNIRARDIAPDGARNDMAHCHRTQRALRNEHPAILLRGAAVRRWPLPVSWRGDQRIGADIRAQITIVQAAARIADGRLAAIHQQRIE